MSDADLAGAIQNSLPQYLRGTKIEIVQLEAKLASAIEFLFLSLKPFQFFHPGFRKSEYPAQ